MSHHTHSHHHPEPYTGNLRVAFFLNLLFAIIEVVGGFMTNSVAILSDALHDFGDSLSLGLAWYFQKLSGKGRDEKYSYGYRRFSILGAIISAIILIIGSVFIIAEAIPRFADPEEVNAQGMIWLALLGIVVNGFAALKLQKGTSLNERMVSFHLLEDVFGWLAVLIGAILMHYFDLPWIDPFLSLVISLVIVYHVYKNLNQSLKIVLQAIPKNTDLVEVQQLLLNHESVQNIHDLHIWSMDGEYNILTAHLVLNMEKSFTEQGQIKSDLYKKLKSKGIHHATLEFELAESDCEFEDC